jgi:DNA-binding CsgD family transcriptional regulator
LDVAHPRVYTLTAKQIEVMELVCLGKTMEEAGMILGVNVNTVKSRWEIVRKKLDAHKDTLAVAKYLAPERFKK